MKLITKILIQNKAKILIFNIKIKKLIRLNKKKL